MESKVLYTYHHNGIIYTIYDREPEMGELSCTWHLEKKRILETKPMPLTVFAYDENCASRSDEYDFKFVTVSKEES